MRTKKGDRVKIHYTIRSESGEILESTLNGPPTELIIGKGKFVAGLEKGLVGMSVGETKTFTVPENEGYGPREERKVFEFSRERIPPDLDPGVGKTLKLYWPDGSSFPVTVIGITEKGFLMDANHPHAGKTLVFDVKLEEMVKA